MDLEIRKLSEAIQNAVILLAFKGNFVAVWKSLTGTLLSGANFLIQIFYHGVGFWSEGCSRPHNWRCSRSDTNFFLLFQSHLH